LIEEKEKISVLITRCDRHRVGATYQFASLLTLVECKYFFVGIGCGAFGTALLTAGRR
jgi:hypothetical protein